MQITSEQPSILKQLAVFAALAIILAAMRSAASLLVPIILSIFFATLMHPIYHWLKLRHFPAVLALLLTILLLIACVFFLVSLIGNSVSVMFSSLGNYSHLFEQRQAELQEATSLAGAIPGLKHLISSLDPSTLTAILSWVLSAIAGILKNGLLILFVTIFFLVEGKQFIVRLDKLLGPEHPLPRKISLLAQLFTRYFGLRVLVNLVTGVGTGLMLWLFSIPHAALWGTLIFFLSFVPYIGSFFATIPPVLLGFSQGGLGVAMAIILLSVVINSLSENIVAPLVMGQGLNLSPTVVFLSFVFWMWILGGAGAFVAMPLTVVLFMIFASFTETRWLAALMGDITGN